MEKILCAGPILYCDVSPAGWNSAVSITDQRRITRIFGNESVRNFCRLLFHEISTLQEPLVLIWASEIKFHGK